MLSLFRGVRVVRPSKLIRRWLESKWGLQLCLCLRRRRFDWCCHTTSLAVWWNIVMKEYSSRFLLLSWLSCLRGVSLGHCLHWTMGGTNWGSNVPWK